MIKHHFIFSPGRWVGEGRITFSSSPDCLRFYTKWSIESIMNESIFSEQRVEMEGGEEHTINQFVFSNIGKESFLIELTNNLLGTIKGKGVMDEKTLAWEFRGNPDFEGFEVYELQENGDYMLHAEYASTDQFRTVIDGRIWMKSPS
jgi:hypothetical protein